MLSRSLSFVSLRTGYEGEGGISRADSELGEGANDVLRQKLQTANRLCELKVKSAMLEEQVEHLKVLQEHTLQTLETERQQWAQERSELRATIERLGEASCSTTLFGCFFTKGAATAARKA
jgi:hypothetical protein